MTVPFTVVIVVNSAPETGSGSRTVAALEHVANRPILHHALDGLAAARVAGIILAGEADTLIDVRTCLEAYQSDWPIEHLRYAVCRDGTSLASTLSAVAPLVGDDACLLQPADGLLEDSVISLFDLLDEGKPDLVLFAAQPSQLDRTNSAWRPHNPGSDGRAGETGVGVFAPGALRKATDATSRYGDIDLSTAGRRLAAAGANVMVHRLDSWHRYTGNRRDLLDLNRLALDRLAAKPFASAWPTNSIEGRVLIDPTALITNSVLIGPTVIGAGAIIDNAYIGPYTSVGAQARIEGAEIERSIVGEHAAVLNVGGRLVSSSVVGRRATVFRDFALPRALRLLVSSGNEIALS